MCTRLSISMGKTILKHITKSGAIKEEEEVKEKRKTDTEKLK